MEIGKGFGPDHVWEDPPEGWVQCFECEGYFDPKSEGASELVCGHCMLDLSIREEAEGLWTQGI